MIDPDEIKIFRIVVHVAIGTDLYSSNLDLVTGLAKFTGEILSVSEKKIHHLTFFNNFLDSIFLDFNNILEQFSQFFSGYLLHTGIKNMRLNR